MSNSIVIRKLSDKTAVADCHKSLRQWLGLSYSDVNMPVRLMVRDLPHEVWICDMEGKRFFGQSLTEAAKEAGILP